MNNLLYKMLVICSALACLIFGAGTLLLSTLRGVRTSFINSLENGSIVIAIIGTAAIIVGSLILGVTFNRKKRKYFAVTTGNNNISVHKSVLEEYLANYLNALFPDSDIYYHSTIKRNKLLITADLPYIPEPEQCSLIEKINEDIGELLASKLGYRKPYHLTISFAIEEPAVEDNN